MSLRQSCISALDNAVTSLLDQISTQHKIPREKLQATWDNGTPKKMKQTTLDGTPLDTQVLVNHLSDPPELSNGSLIKCTREDLKVLCRNRSIPCSGSKAVLIDRLLGKATDADPKPKEKEKKKSPPKKPSPSVIQKIVTVPRLSVHRNSFGNYEHPETGFCVDSKTKKVIGKQNDNGTIDDLTPRDLEICLKYGFEFVTPDNLDCFTSVDNECVEDLDEDLTDIEEEILNEEDLDDNDDNDNDEEFDFDDDDE